MKHNKLDDSLRSAKPKIQQKAAFTARVMERIDVAQASHRKHILANTRIWAVTTTTTVFAIFAIFIISPNKSDQTVDSPQDSQTSSGVNMSPDKTDFSSYTQLAKWAQGDIDAINSGISSVDSSEYNDSGLSDEVLYN